MSSDARFKNPDFVLGCVVAQLEDLDTGDRVDVLQRALASEIHHATASVAEDLSDEDLERLNLSDILTYLTPQAMAMYGDAHDSLDRLLADLVSHRKTATDTERNPGELAIRKEATTALDRVLNSAEAHGEQSDPEHETGDLLDFVRLLVDEAGPEAVVHAADAYWADGREVWS